MKRQNQCLNIYTPRSKKIIRLALSPQHLDPDPDFTTLDDDSIYNCLMFLYEEFGLSNWDEYIHRKRIQDFKKNGISKEDKQLALDMLVHRVKVF